MKTTEGKIFDLDYSLDQIEKMINPELFFRVNRNFLVNINCIDEIVAYSSSRLKLKSGKTEIIVSRDNVAEFKQWMDR
jgi:DNA-binding LytR/AlgR family response regulator